MCIASMKAKRRRVSALIGAKVLKNKICELENCSRALVAKVKRLKNSNLSLACKSGFGGHNRK